MSIFVVQGYTMQEVGLKNISPDPTLFDRLYAISLQHDLWIKQPTGIALVRLQRTDWTGDTVHVRVYLIQNDPEYTESLKNTIMIMRSNTPHNSADDIMTHYIVPAEERDFLQGCLPVVRDPLIHSMQDTMFRTYITLVANRPEWRYL